MLQQRCSLGTTTLRADRLPLTYPSSVDATVTRNPAYPERMNTETGTALFSKGMNSAYRWYLSTDTSVLFPFGFGNHTLVSSTKISESKENRGPASRFLLISPIPAPALGWTFPKSTSDFLKMQAPNTPGCSLLFRPLSDLMTWKLRQGLLEQLHSRSLKNSSASGVKVIGLGTWPAVNVIFGLALTLKPNYWKAN